MNNIRLLSGQTEGREENSGMRCSSVVELTAISREQACEMVNALGFIKLVFSWFVSSFFLMILSSFDFKL